MRTWIFVAAVVVLAQSALGATFENQLHTGSAWAHPDIGLVAWENVGTRVTGAYPGGDVSWDFGILDPQAIRLHGFGFARSLGPGSVSLGNVMTLTVTHETEFLLAGTMTTGFQGSASMSVTISGAGILGAPTRPDGSLRLSGGLGAVSIPGTLLPGDYTIRFSGSAANNGPGQPGSFSANLTLTIPAPTASAPLLAALVLSTRRRRRASYPPLDGVGARTSR